MEQVSPETPLTTHAVTHIQNWPLGFTPLLL